MIGKAGRWNTDRNIGTYLHLSCFVTTNVIWCNYHELFTHPRTHKQRYKVCVRWIIMHCSGLFHWSYCCLALSSSPE